MKLRAGVIDRIEDQNVPVNDTVNVLVNDTVKLSQLTERQCRIYEAIKIGTINVPNNVPKNVPNNVPVNAPNLAMWLNVSEKTIKRDLIAMQSSGIIQHIGPTNGGHWEVII